MDTTTASPAPTAELAAATEVVQAEDLESTLIGKIDWYTDYDAAVELARSLDKPLWVHFGEDPG